MVYDCFSFFNENDLTEVRLHELWDVVDCFVIAEADMTHSGKPKPYCFDHDRFRTFCKKINYFPIKMPKTPQELKEAQVETDGKWATGDIVGDNWTRERYQRDQMKRALYDADPNDIIILEDADEMVRPEVVDNLDTLLQDGLIAVEQSLHSYYINWRCTNMPWTGTKVFRKRILTTLSEQRFHTPYKRTVPNGGWHFNFLGGLEAIRCKVQAYAHQEFNQEEVLKTLGWKLKDGKDALGRGYQYEIVQIDNSYPQYILNNLSKFDALDWIW